MPMAQFSLWLFPFVLPVALWVAYTDLRYMQIRNSAILAMLAIWLCLGWPAAGKTDWLWGFALLGIVLVLGFFGNMLGFFGAGDAKFAAVMAPFFVTGSPVFIALLYFTATFATFFLHRVARRIPLIRNATPDWVSWGSRKFPMGLSLATMLILYLLSGFWPGS